MSKSKNKNNPHNSDDGRNWDALIEHGNLGLLPSGGSPIGPAADPFNGDRRFQNGQACTAFTISPNDTWQSAYVSRWLYVGQAGDLNVVMRDGSTALLKAVPIGMYPLRIRQVKATSTTAAQLVGFV